MANNQRNRRISDVVKWSDNPGTLVNFTLTLPFVLFLLTACGRREEPASAAGLNAAKPPSPASGATNTPAVSAADSAMNSKIQGTWTWTAAEAGKPPRAGSLTFTADGRYVARSADQATGSNEVSYEGGWEITNATLAFNYSKAIETKNKFRGRVDRYRVMRVDDNDLELSELMQRTTNVMHRAK